MLKAAEDLKMQQQIRAEERHKILHERILPIPASLDALNFEGWQWGVFRLFKFAYEIS